MIQGFHPFGEVIHKCKKIAISRFSKRQLQNIHTESVEWSSYRNWGPRGIYWSPRSSSWNTFKTRTAMLFYISTHSIPIPHSGSKCGDNCTFSVETGTNICLTSSLHIVLQCTTRLGRVPFTCCKDPHLPDASVLSQIPSSYLVDSDDYKEELTSSLSTA